MTRHSTNQVVTPEDLMTLEEAMEALRCKRTKLYALLKSGDLPSLTIGNVRFVTRQSISAYLTARARHSTRPKRSY